MHVGMHDEIAKSLKHAPLTLKTLSKTWRAQKALSSWSGCGERRQIADAGVSALNDDARPGLKEFELAAIVEYSMRSLGAEDNFGMVVANNHNQALHPPTDRIVQSGDIVIGEITPCIGGLFVQICRTMVLGEPAPVVNEKYAILKKAMGFGMDAAKTGAPASDIAAAINGTFVEAGYEKLLPAAVHAGARPWTRLRLVCAGQLGRRESRPN